MTPNINLPYMSVFVYVLVLNNGQFISVHKTRKDAVEAGSRLSQESYIHEQLLEDVFNTRQMMESVYNHQQ